MVFAGQNTQGQGNVTGWSDIVAVAAGNDYTVGLKADGSLCYAGAQENSIAASISPIRAAAIAAGPYDFLCLLGDGTVKPFGRLSPARLGTSDWASIGIPVTGADLLPP